MIEGPELPAAGDIVHVCSRDWWVICRRFSDDIAAGKLPAVKGKKPAVKGVEIIVRPKGVNADMGHEPESEDAEE